MEVSVLVAIYKASKYLSDKLEDLRAQSIFNDLHIILLNCQNLENEQLIYNSFSKLHNVSTYQFTSYIRLYESWNFGINESFEHYISNSNVDDLLHPSYYEACVNHLGKSTDAIVSAQAYVTNQFPQRWPNWKPISEMPVFYPGSTMGPCPVWRRALHNKYGYFQNYNVISDARFWEALHDGGETFGSLKHKLIMYYMHNDSLERRIDASGKKLIDIDLAQ